MRIRYVDTQGAVVSVRGSYTAVIVAAMLGYRPYSPIDATLILEAIRGGR